jgi:hypothetical protein
MADGMRSPLSVLVTNTSAQPVTVVGPGTAAVTGNVSVNNTTANPVPVAGSVNVAIAATTPLSVRDTDNPARDPFQCSLASLNSFLSVPSDQRLVIEYIDGRCGVGSTPTMFSAGSVLRLGSASA